jgi:superfamily II DNA or RNA helicase
VIATAKALNEGVDIPNAEMGIVLARNSSKLAEIQMIGRISRKHTYADGSEKKPVFVDIYLCNTKDEHWMRKAQKGMLGQRWVDSVDEIVKLENNTKPTDG